MMIEPHILDQMPIILAFYVMKIDFSKDNRIKTKAFCEIEGAAILLPFKIIILDWQLRTMFSNKTQALII